MNNIPPIILASQSPRRAKILKNAGLEFKVHVPQVQEQTLEGALETVTTNARLKAIAVAPQFPNHLVIAADTVVSHENHILEKPTCLENAHHMLASLSGQKHEVYTAVTFIYRNKECSFHDTTTVTFKQLNRDIIDEYFTICDPLDKAGAYNIDENGEMIIKKISGSYENVMGLPIGELKKMLKKIDF
jgi:septum formation protein